METLDYYSAMFESIDVTLPRDSKERISVEQHCLAKDIVNMIACEGKDRIERHELLGKWRSRLSMAGFKPYPLSSYVNSVIRTLLGCYSDKVCGLISSALAMAELRLGLPSGSIHPFPLSRIAPEIRRVPCIQCSSDKSMQLVKKPGKKEHHLWKKRESAGSGQKALHLVRIVTNLPNEKEAIYGALDKWTAWETEFPVIAAAKALEILRNRKQWLRIIQVFTDMEELGVKPDEDTVTRVGRAFEILGQTDEKKVLIKKYQKKWKYLHFNGERVRVRTEGSGE
ncbi:hypothetical protein J5N97_011709 [Dioscorea zingiberensis]|uniref:Pentatricopeptide repeat-containing protein n=1 Tax=Dioscorea zingiberensis TaxID=325984 RepID=A0A9D5D2M5_9LILI|nr:hypothetical protein J5N97_011709 [Dioscorea zingiberensis]